MKGEREPIDLELAVRSHLGVGADTLELSEKTLAQILRGVSADPLLRALADALDNPDSEWALKLQRRKPGFPTGHNFELERMKSRAAVAEFVEARMQAGDKRKAAVSFAVEKFGLSRATVMNDLREWEAVRAELSAPNAFINLMLNGPRV